ncbi:MAG: hypothetical protein A3F30_02055 [Candidatus Levybacteria bacterium RIFCSPHIGHO2_12_FULL_37_12]|nr:MAG: hypothetical protein A3F30_02055 [Candidatus Levybacteria bacterium RIFCSPHIGHO2_12_FULL_37_12]
MKEALSIAGPDVAKVEQKRPPIFIRNALVAHVIAFVADRILGDGLTSDGRDLLYKLVVRACRGERVSISREVPLVYQGATLKIEADGQNNIPSFGPTMLIGNHTRGGPLLNNGQFIEMASQGYHARRGVQEEEIREPFVIMQKGLGGWVVKRYATEFFYKMAASALNCEIVTIPRFGKNKDNKEVEIVNHQGLRPIATQRIIDGGAALWLPQGTHREPDDLRFPENKGTGFLRKIYDEDRYVQLVPVRSIPDSNRNVKIVFGPAVGISEVIKGGGINYFAQNHIASLR